MPENPIAESLIAESLMQEDPMPENPMPEDPDGPAVTSADDLALLRAFEPVVRFTKGEYFYPVSVERYVARAALWSDPAAGEATLVGEPGSLDIESLAQRSAATQGLGDSLSGIVLSSEKAKNVTIPLRERPPRLQGGSRLAAVGLVARLVDALNRVSLLFRGSVPGGSAAKSYLLQQEHLAPDQPTYHGRVVRDGHWIVCQYWFFYSFNNWRSAFGGVNEHESDWEQVTVYLDGTGVADQDGLPVPRWVVFSAHDETGDDLRRRWDDPDLGLIDGRHPVVHAGAGSHSGAYLAGDYLITIPAPTLGGLVRVLRFVGRVFAPWSANSGDAGLGIPYVDYARGDGRAIGPGADPWYPVLIDEHTGWVRDYRGLWGHDTRDRLGGERGPAGPRYERDGTVRQSWADPVGWAGMGKVAPNVDVEAELIEERIVEVDARLGELEGEIETARHAMELAAAGMAPASPEVRALVPEEQRVLALRMEQTRLRDERARMQGALVTPSPQVDPHAHLKHRRTPLTPLTGRRNRVLSAWAVVSTPVILLALAAVVYPTQVQGVSDNATVTAILWLGILLAIEGLVRGKFWSVMGRLAFVGLLAVGFYYLVVDWRIVLGWVLYGAALLLGFVNIRDAIKR